MADRRRPRRAQSHIGPLAVHPRVGVRLDAQQLHPAIVERGGGQRDGLPSGDCGDAQG